MPSSPYSVKNVKSFPGRNAQGYSATLYAGDKAIAFVVNSDDGCESRFEWKDPLSAAADRKALNEYVTSLPPVESPYKDPDTKKPMSMTLDEGLYVEQLVNEFLTAKYVSKTLKGKIVFLEQGKLKSITMKPSSENIRQVMNSHPNAKIVNTLSESECIAIFIEHNAA